MKEEEDEIILKITSKLLVTVLIFGFLLIMLCFFSKNVLIDIFKVDNELINYIAQNKENTQIDEEYAETLYPFGNDKKLEKQQENYIERYKSKIEKVEEMLEKYSSDLLLGYIKILEIANQYEKCINWNLIQKDSEELPIYINNGYWSMILNERDVETSAKQIFEFKQYLDEKNIDLLYVQTPYKIEDENGKGMLAIYKDYSKQNIDNFLNILKANNIQFLDLRDEIKKENLNTMNLFFKTDHHWLPQTGLWATRKIASELNTLYGMNIDLNKYNMEQYNEILYKNVFLGSSGRKVTLAKAKPENISLIVPKFDTNFIVNIPSIHIENHIGDFEETLIDKERLEKIDYYNNIPYAAYGYGDKSAVVVLE